MKFRNIVITVTLSFVLFVMGFYTFGAFYESMLPRIDWLVFTSPAPGGMMKEVQLYAISLTLIPILTSLVWHYGPVSPGRKRLLVLMLILGSSFLVTYSRMQWFIYIVKDYHEIDHTLPKIELPLEKLKLSQYFLAGLVLGTIISFFLLKDKRKKPEPLNILHE